MLLSSNPIFYDNAESLLRVALSTPVLYLGIIIAIRLTGKRATSQMNNFDWIATVAIGSLLASPILLKDVVVLEALLGIAILLGGQWLVTKLSYHFQFFERLVKARHATLFENGTFCEDVMRKERITRREIQSAVRESGLPDMDRVRRVVLESDAKLSVLPKRGDQSREQP